MIQGSSTTVASPNPEDRTGIPVAFQFFESEEKSQEGPLSLTHVHHNGPEEGQDTRRTKTGK